MANYSLDPNRPTPYVVVDNTTASGREGVYAGPYEDCVAFMHEQPDSWVVGLYDVVPNWKFKK